MKRINELKKTLSENLKMTLKESSCLSLFGPCFSTEIRTAEIFLSSATVKKPSAYYNDGLK